MINIPLVGGAANAHQIFTVQLGSNFLQFTLNYITVAGPAWSLDIDREGVRLVSGAMLEPGADIIQHYNAGIGKLIFVGDDVTLDNLGANNSLVWVAEDEQV